MADSTGSPLRIAESALVSSHSAIRSIQESGLDKTGMNVIAVMERTQRWDGSGRTGQALLELRSEDV